MSALNPQSRALYARLEEVLGDEHAETLMTYLPMEPASELATTTGIEELKIDIAELGERFDHRFERLDKRIDDLHHGMWDQMRTYTVATVTALVALTAIVGAFIAIAFG